MQAHEGQKAINWPVQYVRGIYFEIIKSRAMPLRNAVGVMLKVRLNSLENEE